MAHESIKIRCFCSREPLLAMGIPDDDGNIFIHVKSVRGGKTITEAIITSGIVRLRCRECGRWHTIRMSKMNVVASAENLPQSIHV